MALYTDLPVYRDTYQLILKIFEYTREFSREYKYTLGQEMKKDSLHLVRNLYRANKARERKPQRLEGFASRQKFIPFKTRLRAAYW